MSNAIDVNMFSKAKTKPGYRGCFPARGVTFLQDPWGTYEKIKEGDIVIFECVDDNEYDANAVRLTMENTGDIIGWMPREINGKYREEVSQGGSWHGVIKRVYLDKETPGVRIIPVMDITELVRTSDENMIDSLAYEYGAEFRDEIVSFFQAVRKAYGYPESLSDIDSFSTRRIAGAVRFFFAEDQDVVFISEFLTGVDHDGIERCLEQLYSTGVCVSLIPENIHVDYDEAEHTVVIQSVGGFDPFFRNGNPRSTLAGMIMEEIIIEAFGEEATYQYLPQKTS